MLSVSDSGALHATNSLLTHRAAIESSLVMESAHTAVPAACGIAVSVFGDPLGLLFAPNPLREPRADGGQPLHDRLCLLTRHRGG